MARPVVGAAKDRQLVVRLSADLRARLERVRAILSKKAGGVDLVTSHVIREVIERGLDSIERDLLAEPLPMSGKRARRGER